LTVLNVNPTLAARVGDRWSVGAGADVFHSTFELRQVLPPAFGAPDGTMKFDGDGNGVGWNVGVRFDVNEKQRVGLTYRSPVDVEYDGDFEISGLPIPKSDFETEIDFPSIVVVGYGVDLTERLTVGADVEWVEFSRFDSLVLDAGANNPTIGGPIQVAQDWEDIWTYGVAASFKLSEAVTLRGGYKYMESPIPDRTLAPTLPDGDKHELTAGIGFREGAHRLDLAYAYAFIDDREVSPAENPMGAGEYEITSHILSVTYGLTF
jgi:long-chain fatty acid transport protein